MEVVNEKSTIILPITFKDESGDPVSPTAATYRIDDKESGTELVATTAIVVAGPTYDLTVASAVNRILDQDNEYETRVVTLVWTYGVSSTGTDEYAYNVKNLFKHGDSGSGDTSVDHDTGGADNLTYLTAGGLGVEGAEIKAYLKTDYDSGNKSSKYVKGESITDASGQWSTAMSLNTGYTYTIQFYKAGGYGPNTKEISI